MTQEEKRLLLIDLCSRLPYGVICNLYDIEDANKKFQLKELSNLIISAINLGCIKPYLRSMSSMTEEEENEYRAINCYEGLFPRNEDAIDYVLSHHFDYRGLIEKGIALEAPEGMYKTE